MEAQRITTDVAIIGAGPVGLFTVFQAGMLGMKTTVIDVLPEIGGQCQALYPQKPIYDIPAHPMVTGEELIENLRKQAEPFAPEYVLGGMVEQLTKDNNAWQMVTSLGVTVEAKVVIIAAGCGAFGPNKPPLVGIERHEGNQVFYMVKDRQSFKDKMLVIAGGGDSAVDWANSLAELAKKIYVVHRRDKFRAAPDSVRKMQELAAQGKVELVIPYQLEAIQEDASRRMTGVMVKTLEGEERILPADALLAFFGLSMNLGPISDWGLNLSKNHIAVDPATMATSASGIYAIGDIATYTGKLKLILCGFSEAAIACHNAYNQVFPGKALHFEYSTTRGVPGEK
jgi:thioredoxin reductase (NADPH)